MRPSRTPHKVTGQSLKDRERDGRKSRAGGVSTVVGRPTDPPPFQSSFATDLKTAGPDPACSSRRPAHAPTARPRTRRTGQPRLTKQPLTYVRGHLPPRAVPDGGTARAAAAAAAECPVGWWQRPLPPNSRRADAAAPLVTTAPPPPFRPAPPRDVPRRDGAPPAAAAGPGAFARPHCARTRAQVPPRGHARRQSTSVVATSHALPQAAQRSRRRVRLPARAPARRAMGGRGSPRCSSASIPR